MVENKAEKVKQKNNQFQFSDVDTLHSDVDTLHFQEWLNSGVDPEIIDLNVRSLDGDESHEYLLSDAIASLGAGKKVPACHQYSTVEVSKIKARYQHTLAGGWWCAGLDPLNNWQSMEWGCFKPNQPRKNKEGKVIKYEHPPQSPTRAFFLDVPEKVWDLVASRYGVDIAGDNFWRWVANTNVPIALCEGAKKAACVLSSGYVAIGLPGIFGGHRKDPDGSRHLIPELEWLKNREVTIIFDNDPKPVTRQNVAIAASQLARLLGDKKHQCRVKVARWEYPEKGIDDVFAAHGEQAVNDIIDKAESIQLEDNRQAQKYYKFTPSKTLNCQYLPDDLLLSNHRLIAIRSPKGTGKTEILKPLIKQAQSEGITILDCSHRCQLAMAHSARLGIRYIDELDRSATVFDKFLDGFSFVVDSLHHQGKAAIDANFLKEFKYYLIIDELEQVLWHLLNSKTEIAKHRGDVIFYMRLLLENADKVIVLDADLSDICIKFIQVCMNCKDDDYIIYANEYNPPGCDLFVSRDKTPASLVKQAIERITKGENLLILTDSKSFKAAYGSKNLEQLLIKKCGLHPSEILRIDAESIADPSHPAFGCVDQINEIVKKYRIVIASPVIATGISIDIRDHFTAVYGIFWGVQCADSVRQQLARLRDNVPRYLWINQSGLSRIGNGSSNPSELLNSQNCEFKLNIEILKNAVFDVDSDRFSTDCEALNLYCKMAARLNSEISSYRAIVCDRLIQEGHRLCDSRDGDGGDGDGDGDAAIDAAIQQNREENYSLELQAISDAEVAGIDYQKLKRKKSKTQKELQKERKFAISQRYGDCSPEIIRKDDDGWYAQIRLHYFLLNPELATHRDRSRVEKELDRDRHWQPDINLWSFRVALLGVIGMKDLIYRSSLTASDLQEFMRVTDRYKSQIESICGWLPMQAIARFKKFCHLLGLDLKRVGRQSSGERLWIYAIEGLNDGRDKVHQFWYSQDLYQGDTESVPIPDIYNVKNLDIDNQPTPTPPTPTPPTPLPTTSPTTSPTPTLTPPTLTPPTPTPTPLTPTPPTPLPSPTPLPIPCKVWWWDGWRDALYDSITRIATLLNCDRRVKVFDACQLILG